MPIYALEHLIVRTIFRSIILLQCRVKVFLIYTRILYNVRLVVGGVAVGQTVQAWKKGRYKPFD